MPAQEATSVTTSCAATHIRTPAVARWS